ncbi:MAG: sugar phosphate isomerase/epimerase family protein [Opitutaceae bacterium]|nr:sugar phosphate isomerase/epimerase family protein [Opitutaceae bacterium]
MMTRRQFVAATTTAAALTVVPSQLRAVEPTRPRWPIIGFTKPFQNLSFDAAADTVAEIGWDGIECPVRPKGQIEPERAAEDLPRLAEALKRHGRVIAQLATNITSVAQPNTERVLRTAAALGIKRYRLGEWRYDLQKPIADQLANVTVQLRDLAALNRELGLQAGFQNHSGLRYVGGPVWDLWTAMQGLDARQMGICFDIGHATVEGGTVWPVNARLMRDRLTAVIVKDFIWQRTAKGWEPQWVGLGDGMINREFFRWLRTTTYAGPIIQHHEYDHGKGAPMIARMQQDLKVLREWLAA